MSLVIQEQWKSSTTAMTKVSVTSTDERCTHNYDERDRVLSCFGD